MTDAQKQRTLERHIDSESRWLQKTLFALTKARQAREKYAEASGKKLAPLIKLKGGTKVPLDTIEEIVQSRINELMEQLGQRPPTRDGR